MLVIYITLSKVDDLKMIYNTVVLPFCDFDNNSSIYSFDIWWLSLDQQA